MLCIGLQKFQYVMKTESFYKEIRYTAACMNMIEKDTKASEKVIK